MLANQSKSRRHASKRPAAKARKERLHHTQTAWQLRTERASRQRPVVPKVAFCTYKKLAVFLLLPPLSPAAAKAQKERLRHTQTAGQWRTELACGQRPVLPNVAFCTYKKLAVFLLLPPLYPAFLLLFLAFLLLLPGAGQPIQIPPPCLETSSCQGSKRAASPHSNSVAVKDGQRPVVPDVAFCTYKKLAVFLLLPFLVPCFLEVAAWLLLADSCS